MDAGAFSQFARRTISLLFLSFDKCLARLPSSLPDVYLTCLSSSFSPFGSEPSLDAVLHQFVRSSATASRMKGRGLNGRLHGMNLAVRSGNRQIGKSDRRALPRSPRSGVARIPARTARRRRPVPGWSLCNAYNLPTSVAYTMCSRTCDGSRRANGLLTFNQRRTTRCDAPKRPRAATPSEQTNERTPTG
jgi:hypothetical protein